MTWLLSVGPAAAERQVDLWRLEPGAAGDALVSFRADAALALDRADALARSELPLLASPDAVRRHPSWRARWLAGRQGPLPTVLDGGSFGLAMGLAVVSSLVNQACPPHIVACAALGADGRLQPVDGLADKLGLLVDLPLPAGEPWTVLVHPSQVADASGAGAIVVPVQSLSEALEVVWGGADALVALVATGWGSEESRERAAASLYRLVMEGAPRVLRWSAVAKATEALLDLSGEDAVWAADLDIARRIAHRHAGNPLQIRIRDDLDGLRRPLRLHLLAHEVQSAADGCAADWEESLAVASEHVAAPNEEHAEDLMLLGAMGRALAAWGRYADAQGCLRRAVRGWLELGRELDASVALCELLRVVGVGGQLPDPEITGAVRLVRGDLRVSHSSRSFLALAHGRALLQAGQTRAGIAELEGSAITWTATRPHVQASRHQWLAVAVYGEDPARSREHWRALERLAEATPSEARYAHRLAELDRVALGEVGEELLVPALTRLLAEEDDGRRILRFSDTEDAEAPEQAAALRRHWRY